MSHFFSVTEAWNFSRAIFFAHVSTLWCLIFILFWGYRLWCRSSSRRRGHARMLLPQADIELRIFRWLALLAAVAICGSSIFLDLLCWGQSIRRSRVVGYLIMGLEDHYLTKTANWRISYNNLCNTKTDEYTLHAVLVRYYIIRTLAFLCDCPWIIYWLFESKS